MHGLRILIVDDDKEFLALLSKSIESWGYEVISASGGKEALGMIKNKKADIVILDYLMPNMNGAETLEKIRRIDKKVPVIMFTASVQNMDTRIKESGADDYLLKPFNPEQLLEKVKKFLD